MAGHRSYIPRPDIPLRSAVRDRRRGWVGVLVSYGSRAARVQFHKDQRRGEWVNFYDLEAVSDEELAAIVQREKDLGRDLV